MPILRDTHDWGIEKTLCGDIGYDEIYDSFRYDWEVLDWDSIAKRLIVVQPDAKVLLDQADLMGLAKMMAVSGRRKLGFINAYCDLSPNRRYANILGQMASELSKSPDLSSQYFTDRAQAIAWIRAINI